MEPGDGRMALLPPVAADVARRIAEGDPLAEAELIERYRSPLLLVALYRTRDRAEAEDLCQEAFRVAIEELRAGHLRDTARVGAYLRGIVVNLARHQWRGRRPEAGDVADRVDLRPGPHERADSEERARLARHAVSRLPPRDREVLARFFLGEEDKSVICKDMGLSPGQFDVIKFRALRRVRLAMEGLGVTEPGI